MYKDDIAHLMPQSLTKHLPVCFILNPGYIEYELVYSMSENFLNPNRIQTHNLPLPSQTHQLLAHPAHIIKHCKDWKIDSSFITSAPVIFHSSKKPTPPA